MGFHMRQFLVILALCIRVAAQVVPGTSTANNVAYVDGTTHKTVQDAINSFGTTPGLVIVPPNYVGPSPAAATISDNVTVWDYSKSGRLIIYSNPTENAAGSSGAGISILSGKSTGTGTCWPNALPSANNLVATYICNAATSRIPVWAVNTVTILPSNAPDTEIWGNEIDVNIFGKERSSQYVGLDVVSGGQVPATHAVRAYTAPGAGVWAHAFRVSGQMGSDLFEVDSPDTGLTLTRDVSAKNSIQTVEFSGKFGASKIGVGGKVSVDSGNNQEDVILTGGAGHNIAGIFTKNHRAGASIAPYSANRILASNNAVTASVPYYLGNLRSWSDSNTPQVLGFSVGDLSGTERRSDFFVTSTAQHVWRDVGIAGFAWQGRNGTLLLNLSGSGQLGLQNCQLGGVGGTISPAACGAAPTGMIAVPPSQTSYTIDTKAVTANSEIFIQQMTDNSGLPSSPSCSSSPVAPMQASRAAAGSFTFTLSSIGSVTCFKYWIVN